LVSHPAPPSGISMLTQEMVHDGHAAPVLEARANTVQAAFDVHPEQFQGKQPKPAPLHGAEWIN